MTLGLYRAGLFIRGFRTCSFNYLKVLNSWICLNLDHQDKTRRAPVVCSESQGGQRSLPSPQNSSRRLKTITSCFGLKIESDYFLPSKGILMAREVFPALRTLSRHNQSTALVSSRGSRSNQIHGFRTYTLHHRRAPQTCIMDVRVPCASQTPS